MLRNSGPILILLGLWLCAWPLSAATLDPLLVLLLDQQSGKSSPLFDLDDLIVIERPDKSGQTRVGVILQLETDLPDLSSIEGLAIGSTVAGIATARLPLHGLRALAAVRGIRHIAAARISRPTLDLAVEYSNVDQVWNGVPAYIGRNVLVGVIDTGIDWRHPDFRNPDGSTRIMAIWDVFNDAGDPPAGFNAGTEYTRDEIDAALSGNGSVAMVDPAGHGTHVAGIAAGNGRASGGLYRGVAYGADLLIAKPYRNGFPETETIDAMNYLVQKAQALGRPIVINMSLGSQFGGHDGSEGDEVAIDALSGSGVAFCVSAGNGGEDSIAQRVPAVMADFDLRVPDYTPNEGRENDKIQIMIWYDGDTNPEIGMRIGDESLGPVMTGDRASTSTPQGVIWIDNASLGAYAANGDKTCLIQLSDDAGSEIAEADWTISIRGGSGWAHAWVVNATMEAGFPESDQSYSLDMPGTARRGISVAAFKTRQSWTSVVGDFVFSGQWGALDLGDRALFSGMGPTRDGREKPDISAPGMGIISAYSADQSNLDHENIIIPGRQYIVLSGTSMSAPVVSGVVAMIFEKNPDLGADEIREILRDTAHEDLQTGVGWSREYGAGKLDAAAALAAVSAADTDYGGDVDQDGGLDLSDISLLADHILDPVGAPLDVAQREAADVFPVVDGDDNLDIHDVARLVAYNFGATITGRPSIAPLPAAISKGEPRRRDGLWWLPITLSGNDLVGCQFSIEVPDAQWRVEDLRHDGDGANVVQLRSLGNTLRVMVYNTSWRIPSTGLTLEIPFQGTLGDKSLPTLTGVMAADPYGFPRSIIESGSLPTLPTILFLEMSPNPSSGAVTIGYQLSVDTPVTMEIFDLRGRLVQLFENPSPGLALRSRVWDRRDQQMRRVADGLYLLRLSAGGRELQGKIVLTR